MPTVSRAAPLALRTPASGQSGSSAGSKRASTPGEAGSKRARHPGPLALRIRLAGEAGSEAGSKRASPPGPLALRTPLAGVRGAPREAGKRASPSALWLLGPPSRGDEAPPARRGVRASPSAPLVFRICGGPTACLPYCSRVSHPQRYGRKLPRWNALPAHCIAGPCRGLTQWLNTRKELALGVRTSETWPHHQSGRAAEQWSSTVAEKERRSRMSERSSLSSEGQLDGGTSEKSLAELQGKTTFPFHPLSSSPSC
nr:uncharacterized protein LOC129009928 [Pongo pygmaeus]